MWSELPTELLLQIFEYLEPMFLIRTVAKVCLRFKNVLHDECYSRLNYYQLLIRWSPYVQDVPLVNHLNIRTAMDWKDLGSHLKLVKKRWQEPIVHSFRGSVCPVDAVHILKRSTICLVGNREKSIDLWDVRGMPKVRDLIPAAHNGWVMSLDSYEEHSFVSGGWDSFIKLWQVRESSCQSVWSLDCQRGVMSVAARHDMVAIATFSPALTLVDPRATHPVLRCIVHTKAIADVAMSGNYVISVARDRALNVFDIRMMDTALRRSRFAGTVKGGLPKCLTVLDNIVYIGDSRGYVHMLDLKTDFRAFHSIPVTRSPTTVTSIIPDFCTFLCGTSDGILRVVVPSKDHYVLKQIGCARGVEITTMSYENQILAVGKTSGVVECYPSRVSEDPEVQFPVNYFNNISN